MNIFISAFSRGITKGTKITFKLFLTLVTVVSVANIIDTDVAMRFIGY